MGWVSYLVSQAVLTSVALGALKRHGAIALVPEKIQNETLRAVIVKAVSVGEDLTALGERLYSQAYEQVSKK